MGNIYDLVEDSKKEKAKRKKPLMAAKRFLSKKVKQYQKQKEWERAIYNKAYNMELEKQIKQNARKAAKKRNKWSL